MPKQFFLNPEFVIKFQREVLLYLDIPDFFSSVYDWRKEAVIPKIQLDSLNRFDRTPTCGGQTETDRRRAITIVPSLA